MSETVDKYSRKGLRTSYISTVIGISLVLFMIGLVIGGMLGLKSIQTQAKENLQGDLFFRPELNAADIKQIELELSTWKEFKDVYFVSPDRAMDEFSGDTPTKHQILAIFEKSNPLPPTIGYRPKEEYASKQGMKILKNKILKAYKDQIDEVNYDKSSVEQVNLGFKQFVFLFLVVAALLIVVAVAMINNTIRLALYSKRFTIKTMQLVGATASFIRKPFIVQSILQGLVSALVGMAILLGLFYALNNFLDSIEIAFDLKTLLFLFAILLVLGIVITLVSTWFALNKYLRMKLDDLY
ncbi:MAG: permease-like cell division protein FtsX [Crocinitomicaceae bacterium]|nr:permease-like cell division protein FtsX [Crocinitomicaceae bacterium]